ncbi:homoserine kinase [Desulfosporosinus acidiphilus SJ4]|uniref:Homoserine kinase n=1 Tax=Desulfosporosinus acidiphilus (strain DSM 22704 / JCM 16185 / SJ4) TaxID=646529 RepID=I4D8N0_DESAJ|nr:homoserine kinase [Desulfosporosinus acidiphilus]AFM42154.1 homoserine kinase [Desulfosporosinus acidiphilus SJ4]
MIVKIPATSANLGPGFDCLGLALQLYNSITIETDRPFRISLTGTYNEGIATDETNLVWRTMRHLWESINYPIPTVALTLENNIPPARGLGSSSAAIVGGLAAANVIAGTPLSKLELLQIANTLEGHPDNVTPALYGGITLAVSTENGILPRVLGQGTNLKAVVLIPNLRLKTEKARSILPPNVSRQDAVFNISHAGLLIDAFIRENYPLLKEAMRDMLHQNQRSVLIPGMFETLKAAEQAGAYGTALSGSGPTLIALVPEISKDDVRQKMLSTIGQFGVEAQALTLDMDHEGVIFSEK